MQKKENQATQPFPSEMSEEEKDFSERLSLVIPSEKDKNWFRSHYKKLQRQFGGKWVAVYDQQIVASGNQISEAEQQYQNPYIAFIENVGSVVL